MQYLKPIKTSCPRSLLSSKTETTIHALCIDTGEQLIFSMKHTNEMNPAESFNPSPPFRSSSSRRGRSTVEGRRITLQQITYSVNANGLIMQAAPCRSCRLGVRCVVTRAFHPAGVCRVSTALFAATGVNTATCAPTIRAAALSRREESTPQRYIKSGDTAESQFH